MTKLIMDPNKPGWTLPQTLRQGENFYSNTGVNEGIVNFDVNTGKPLTQNQTTIIPSYQNLTSNPPVSGGTVPAPVDPKIMSFTQALIQILKDAQGANTKGQAGLMNQSNQIKGLGLNDATTNFANPLLAPNDGTSLGMSAQNEFDPSLNSIADQQKLATQNLGNITDLVNMTGDNYQKEQDRIQRAKDDAANRAVTAANKAKSDSIKLTPTDKQGLLAAGFLPAEITSIENDVNKYGINKVLEGITDTTQKTAIQKVYGGIVKDISTKLTRANVSLLFDLTDDGSKSGFLGLGKTTSQKLDDIMNIIQRYQAVGYTDDEILKLIQSQ